MSDVNRNRMIVLVFTDGKRIRCDEQKALELCQDTGINGKIVDALTDNVRLQDRLREIIDKDYWKLEQKKKQQEMSSK